MENDITFSPIENAMLEAFKKVTLSRYQFFFKFLSSTYYLKHNNGFHYIVYISASSITI